MAYPVYIIEGADCSGKTTLGEFLAKQFKATYIHATYRFPKQMFDYHTALAEKVLKLSQTGPVILDRWWPSELIYAEVFRGGSQWPMGGRMLDRIALKHGWIYVGCIPQDQEWHKRTFDERAEAGGEMYTKNDEVAKLYREWDERMVGRLDYMRYDVGLHGKNMAQYGLMLNDLATHVQMSLPYPWDQDERQWAGNPRSPLVMILGERSNPKGRHKVWPFFEHQNSSLWLTTILSQVGIREEQIAWMNVEADGGASKYDADNLRTAYDLIKPHYVLALGSVAQKTCVKAGIMVPEHGFRALPHPAYVKRFQNGNSEQYVQLLTEIKEHG